MRRTHTISFVADISRALRDIDRLEKRMNRMGGKTQGEKVIGTPGGIFGGSSRMSQILGMFGALTNSTSLLVTAFGGLNPAIVAATTAFYGFIKLMEKTFEVGNLVEGAQIQMEQIMSATTKNADVKANEYIKKAMKESLVTPYSPTQMISAVQLSTQYGMDPFKKGAHGLKKDQQLIDIINSMGAAKVQGKMVGPEQAAYAIARGNRKMLIPYGLDVQRAYDESKKFGLTGSQKQVDAFIARLGKIPYLTTMAKKQAESMAGMWSTIAGFADEFFYAFSGAGEREGTITFWSQVKDILRDVRDSGIAFMTMAAPYITEIGTAVGMAFKTVWELLKFLFKIWARVFGPPLAMTWQFIRMIATAVGGLVRILLAFLKMAWEIGSFIYKIVDKLFGISDSFQKTIYNMKSYVIWLQVLFQLFYIYITWIFREISAWMDKILAKWDYLFKDRMAGVAEQFAMSYGVDMSDSDRGITQEDKTKAELANRAFKYRDDPKKATRYKKQLERFNELTAQKARAEEYLRPKSQNVNNDNSVKNFIYYNFGDVLKEPLNETWNQKK